MPCWSNVVVPDGGTWAKISDEKEPRCEWIGDENTDDGFEGSMGRGFSGPAKTAIMENEIFVQVRTYDRVAAGLLLVDVNDGFHLNDVVTVLVRTRAGLRLVRPNGHDRTPPVEICLTLLLMNLQPHLLRIALAARFTLVP